MQLSRVPNKAATPSPTLTAGARTVAVRPLTLRLPPGRYETLGAAVEGLERDRLQHGWRARVDAAEATLHSLSTAGAEPAAAEEEAVVGALVGGGGAVRPTQEDIGHDSTALCVWGRE